jgi:hypothetical protein
MRTRTIKRLLMCVGIAFIGALIWITIEDARKLLDVRSAVPQASAIAYGRFISDGARSRIVIEEIWRHASSGDPVAVGASLPHRIASDATAPDGVVILFSPRLLSRRLVPGTIIGVYGDRVAEMSVSEFKALCAATQSSDQTMPQR